MKKLCLLLLLVMMMETTTSFAQAINGEQRASSSVQEKDALKSAIAEIFAIKKADEKEKRLNEVLIEFNLDTNKKADAAKVGPAFSDIGLTFYKEKNYQKAEFYIDKIESKLTRAVYYYSLCRNKEDIKNNLPFHARISKKSLELVEMAKLDKEDPKYYKSRAEYLDMLTANYILYGAAHANVLEMMGKNAEALALMKDIVTKNNFSGLDTNMSYLELLVKNGKNAEAKAAAERFVSAGQANEKLKNILKTLCPDMADFGTYYASLEKAADAQRNERFAKRMINIPAPAFALKNPKGELVELAALKGKTVVLDYWATWCGPCLKSFPGMQMAVEKYKDDPNVVFLFINTFEHGENREKEVSNWILTHPKYTFNILLDNIKPGNTGQYEAASSYKIPGVPTKFIIDGNGNIRFKMAGFDGTPEAVVKELDIMIALAKAGGRM